LSCKHDVALFLLLAVKCSLISDDLRKGLMDQAEHTFRIALTVAVLAGCVMMLLMEVRPERCHGWSCWGHKYIQITKKHQVELAVIVLGPIGKEPQQTQTLMVNNCCSTSCSPLMWHI